MEQRRPDPFFEQLKADIQEGIDAGDRGEVVSEDEFQAHFRRVGQELRAQEKSAKRSGRRA